FGFFFQAEDGIRDFHVTGVQTCALPICSDEQLVYVGTRPGRERRRVYLYEDGRPFDALQDRLDAGKLALDPGDERLGLVGPIHECSDRREVGVRLPHRLRRAGVDGQAQVLKRLVEAAVLVDQHEVRFQRDDRLEVGRVRV